uniref:Phosphodiesterase 2A n=1 Tax=Nothoprocta perdicaria TaxID=30464 RepID=A0A8C6ZRD3_NOTPE
MVLVLQHLLTALVQFFRRGQQVVLKAEDSAPGSEALQDALLSLGAVLDGAGLRQALRDALLALLPRVEHVYVYLLEGEGRLTCDNPPHELPPDGKLRCTVAP